MAGDRNRGARSEPEWRERGEPMNPAHDHRDVPLQVARRAAEQRRKEELRRQDRWRTPLRALAWLSGIAGIVVLTVLARPLWQPLVDGGASPRQAGATSARAESASVPGGTAAQRDSRASEAGDVRMPEAAPPSTAPAPAHSAARDAVPTVEPAPPRSPAASQSQESDGGSPAIAGTPAGTADTGTADIETADTETADTETANAPMQSTGEAAALREQADGDLRRGRLQQAAEGYRALLEASPGDDVAEDGLARVAAAHAARAQRAAADFEFDSAEGDLATARELAPEAAAVREAARDLQRARAARARMPSTTDVARQGRVRSLIDQADAALARGDLMDPPGESAFDKIAAARALAPGAPEVRSAARRLELARQSQGSAQPR